MMKQTGIQELTSVTDIIQTLVLFALLTFSGMSWYNNDWSTYGVNILARMGEFENYFVAQSASQNITPQFFVDYLVIIWIKMGFSYMFATMFWYIISCITLISGIVFLSRIFSNKFSFSCSAIVVIYLVKNNFGFGISGNSLWHNSIVHAVFASTFCVWAMYFIFERRRRFALAYLMCAIAAFIQIQVGFYYGLIILIYHIIFVITNKEGFKWQSAMVWLLSLVLLYFLFNNSEKMLSDQQFVEIYARLRHPHHMIPSSWSSTSYFYFMLFLFSIISLFYKEFFKKKQYADLLIWFVTICTATLLSLFVNYVFTDLYPLAIIAKVQPARMVSVTLLSVLPLIICLTSKFIEKRDYFPVLSFMGFLFFNSLSIFLFINVFYIWINSKNCYDFLNRKIGLFISKLTIPITIIALIITVSFGVSSFSINYFLCMICIVLVSTTNCKNSKIAITVPLLFYIFYISITPNFFKIGIDDHIYNLSMRFKNSTDVNVIYYADPLKGDFSDVTFFSRRTPVVFNKNVPIYDRAILKWLDRLIDFGFIEEDGLRYYYKQSNLSTEQIIDKALKYNATFIFTQKQEVEVYLQTKRVMISDFEGNYYLLKIIN